MSNVVKLPRKVKPLTATYNPSAPYVVERVDDDDGDIRYEVMDTRQDSYRIVCFTSDAHGKHDAEQIVRGLNLLVQYGKEVLPKMKRRE